VWRFLSSIRKPRLGLATWIVLLGALATLPLCIFLYASFRAELAQLRTDAQVSQSREAAGAARALRWRIQVVASHLRFIDKLSDLNGGQLVMPDGELVRGLVSISDQPPPGNVAKPSAGAAQLALSPFIAAQQDVFAYLSVPRAAPRTGVITGKVSLGQLLGDRAGEPGLAAYLIDQNGRILNVGSATVGGARALPLLRTSAEGVGQRVDLARLHALPAIAEVLPGWTIAVPDAPPSLAAREESLRERVILGGALSLCLGLILLHFVAQRLRREVDEVVTDFGDLDGQAPNSVISEFAQIGGALASARAKAGRTAMELERAKHDSLTGLPGRELFLAQAQGQLQAARAMDDHGVALLYIDLDGFKAVNDTLGHRAGDEILKQVAATLRQCVRSPDVVGRTGGDEFVVCFAAPRGLLSDLAARACERISEGVSRLDHNVGCSIGWAIAGSECDLLALIDEADAAMYLAKSARKHEMRMAAAAAKARV
jgi:diguanylate cyclase (GGDEF)-like protein